MPGAAARGGEGGEYSAKSVLVSGMGHKEGTLGGSQSGAGETSHWVNAHLCKEKSTLFQTAEGWVVV